MMKRLKPAFLPRLGRFDRIDMRHFPGSISSCQPMAWSERPRSGSLGTWLSPDGSAFGERGRGRPRRSRIGEPRTTETEVAMRQSPKR
jgi:hypothetical protein